MATETSLTMKAKSPENKTVSTSIRYINPDITDAIAKEYAQMLNALTQNTYESLTKIVKEELY